MTWGLLQLPGHDGELSVYGTEAYYTGPGSRVRRFAYRLDGFVALHAGSDGGEAVTRPIRFQGNKLVLNARTTERGTGHRRASRRRRQPDRWLPRVGLPSHDG